MACVKRDRLDAIACAFDCRADRDSPHNPMPAIYIRCGECPEHKGSRMEERISQFNKADGGKSNPLLLEKHMVRALASVNAVLDYGVQKYEPQGWRKVEAERYDKSARRHRIWRDKGETHDQESGLLHLSHEVCNLLFQIEMLLDADPGVNSTVYKDPPTEHRK